MARTLRNIPADQLFEVVSATTPDIREQAIAYRNHLKVATRILGKVVTIKTDPAMEVVSKMLTNPNTPYLNEK